jgi:hypothetical protein
MAETGYAESVGHQSVGRSRRNSFTQLARALETIGHGILTGKFQNGFAAARKGEYLRALT